MSIKELPHERTGWGAVLIVLLILAGAMTVVGVVIWLRMAPQGEPSQPKQAGRSHSELRYEYPYRVPAAAYRLNLPTTRA